MCNEMFRARHRNRALCGDEFGELKGLLYDFIATALNDFGYKPQFLGLDRRESSRSVSELAHERVVPGNLGQERQRADVRCESDVDFLFHLRKKFRIASWKSEKWISTRTLIAKLVFAAA